MGVIQIRKAQREGARLLIGLSSVSGGGKTFTAIQLAYGLTNYQPGKIGFLDTENRRGSLYADILEKATPPSKEPFLIGDLIAPFSPQRYVDAIEEFQKAGVEVLIVDSGSHEWEGLGGCQEMAEAGNPRMPNWNAAKKEHKKFMNKLLQCDMHVILCLRAREKAKPEKQMIDGKEKTVFVDLGLQPITEKNVLFEMTASLMLFDQGRRQEVVKCPAELASILGRGTGYITAADGKALRAWVDGAKQLDSKIEAWKNRLISNTEQGEAHLKDCWQKTPAEVRKALGDDFYQSLIDSARGHDKMRDLEIEGEKAAANDNTPVAETQASIAAAAALAAKNAQKPEPAPAPAPAPPVDVKIETPGALGEALEKVNKVFAESAPPAPAAEPAPAQPEPNFF